jgi:hypothetical protein
MQDEETILRAIHERASLWGSDRCKRSSLEDALERKVSRHGYGVTDATVKIDALVATGTLCCEGIFVLDPKVTGEVK